MGRVLAVSYGSNAVPAGGTGVPANSLMPEGAVAVSGGYDGRCSATKKDGTPCTAFHTTESELCAGHLRSEGRL